MRHPFEGIFPPELVSERKLKALVLLAGVMNLIAIFMICKFEIYPSFGSMVLQIEDPNWRFQRLFLWIATVFDWIFVVAFFNLSAVYVVVSLFGSAELRVLLRWALHASVWTFLLCAAWYVSIAILPP